MRIDEINGMTIQMPDGVVKRHVSDTNPEYMLMQSYQGFILCMIGLKIRCGGSLIFRHALQ